jgi:hypothetical protein
VDDNLNTLDIWTIKLPDGATQESRPPIGISRTWYVAVQGMDINPNAAVVTTGVQIPMMPNTVDAALVDSSVAATADQASLLSGDGTRVNDSVADGALDTLMATKGFWDRA